MRSFTKIALGALIASAATSGVAQAQTAGLPPVQDVTNDIDVATNWTTANRYDLRNQIYVTNGATLTIDAGVIVDTTPTVNGGGAIAVTRGSRIFVNGTALNPVLFTTSNDVATWTNQDPKTGVWREASSEWGNLTIMGNGFISESNRPGCTVANTDGCNAANVSSMEGLLESPMNPGRTLYGGGDDDDNSGAVTYASFRYGGRVLGVGDELNGLSLGGVGRGTDIHHVEVMNNVDDGIEIWGGTVNLKYFCIYNVGDDSFDVDQGWRGKAQYGLIVQGYSTDDSQGSGVGDNGFEFDGSEASDQQPKTTATLYHCTFVGQPLDGDGATAWRDGARVQYRNCIFMDCGEQIVRFDNTDGETCNGEFGYGFGGTLQWADCWQTAAGVATGDPNECLPYGTFYQSQVDGNLCEISDSVLFNNGAFNAYTQIEDIGGSGYNALTAGGNVKEPGQMPIKGLTRAATVVRGGLDMQRVTSIDPRPAADALDANDVPPNDGFFSTGNFFRGAFDPCFGTWLQNWSATARYGFLAPKLLAFNMLVGSNELAEIQIKKNSPRTATICYQGNVICDEAPVTITNQSPLTGTFNCGPYTFTVQQNGPNFTWSTNGGPSGTLQRR